MWEYTYNLENELYHYGVKGMKWGHRKNPEVVAARQAYKAARKDFKKINRTASRPGFGIEGIQNAKKAIKARPKAEMKYLDAKAAYKVSKAKTEKQKAKAEFNTYRKAMQKSGIRGSAADVNNGNRSTRIYDHVKAKKGKAYADKLEKKVQNYAVAGLVGSTAVMVGATAVEMYLINSY